MQQLGVFIVNNWLLFLALVVIISMLVMTTLKPKLLGFSELKPLAAVQFMNRNDVIRIDLREDGEFQQGHVIDALHIPLDQLEQRLQELEQFRCSPIMVFCRTGQRSARAAALLKRNGFDSVYKLSGGMMAWQGANLPVSKGPGAG